MVGNINNLGKIRTDKTNPYFRLDFKKVDNSLEEALLPQHDQVTLSFISHEINQKGFAVLKGKYGEADVNLKFTSAGPNTLLVQGHVGETKIEEFIAMGVSYGPVKKETIEVNGKKVDAVSQTAYSFATSSVNTLKTIMNYSSSYQVKTYKYSLNGKQEVKAEGKQEISTQLLIANPLTQEAEMTTTFNPYRRVKQNEMLLTYMNNHAKMQGKLYSIRFKDNRKVSGKQHKVEIEYNFKDGKMIVEGTAKNIYKPAEQVKFFYVVS